MTQVNILISGPSQAGTTVPAVGMLRFTPTKTHIVGTAFVMPLPFIVTLDATGAATVTLEATTSTWVWAVDTYINGVSGYTKYVTVPATGTVNYTDLVEVDLSTLTPTAAPSPAWVAMANSTVTTGAIVGNDLVLTRTDGSTVDAGNVRGPAGPANTLTMGTVTTTQAGTSATANITGTAPAQTLNLSIPRGSDISSAAAIAFAIAL